jgi:hypothetical protein
LLTSGIKLTDFWRRPHWPLTQTSLTAGKNLTDI